jgi:hypothetical protein
LRRASSTKKPQVAMADAQLELPCQLDAESVRALALGINGNPFAALGPHDTRAGRIIRAFLPSTTKVELLRRPDGASRLAFALGQGLPQPAHDPCWPG